IRLGRNDGAAHNFPAYSGWVKFDISTLSSCFNITSAILHYNAFTNATSESDCSVYGALNQMTNDPVTATDASRLTDIRDGAVFSTKEFKINSTGWQTTGIANGLSYLTSSIPTGWFAVGLYVHSGRENHMDCYIDV